MPAYTPAGAPRKSGGALQVIVVLVVLTAVIVGAYFVFRKDGEKQPPNGNGKITGPQNGGKPPDTNGTEPPPPPPPVAVDDDIDGAKEFRKGDYKTAAEKLAAYVKKEPKNTQAHYMLGQSYLKLGQTAEAEVSLGEALKLDPRGAAGAAAALSLGDSLYDRHYAKVEEQDRTKWQRIREVYSIALRTVGYGPERKQLVGRLNKLNAHLIWSRMTTGDSKIHTVLPGESVERIGVAYGLPRDCTKSISRINKLPKGDIVRPDQKIKVITRLNMEILVSKKHFTLTAWLNGYFFAEFPVGIGKGGATPIGEFVIKPTKGKDKEPIWYTRDEHGKSVKYPFKHPKNILGTRWMGFVDQPKIGATSLGIHGTGKPETIGTKSSAGCIRMHNKDVEKLFDFTPGGSKVKVVN